MTARQAPSRRVDLSPGEQVRLWRRRMALGRTAAAAALGVSRARLGAVERDDRDPGFDLPWTGDQALTAAEKCRMYRMRSGGVRQADIADALGCTRVWVNRMERGLEPADRLLFYWES